MLIAINGTDFDKYVVTQAGYVLVEFYAPWCNNCSAMETILEMIEEENYNKLKVFKLDIEENESLADQYEVMTLPTMVLFKDGRAIATQAGLTSYNDMLGWLKI